MNSSKKIPKKQPTEIWAETLQKTGVSMSGNMAGRNSISGLKKLQMQGMSYSSTSHFLRQMAGTEKTKRNGNMTPRSARSPAYKTPEEYYDDILDLKKQLAGLNHENSNMKSKVRRLEEDNIKKEKEIEQLLDPTKSDELRRTLAEKKPDTGIVIHGLKQKILKLEHGLKDKESAFSKLQSDIKNTKVEEMKLHTEIMFQEVQRLRTLKVADKSMRISPNESKENSSKLKALQETILRMNEKNVRLTSENKSLKQDLDHKLQELEENKVKQSEYEDMNKKQLLSAITKLENRLDKQDDDSSSILSDIENRKKDIAGKLSLEGPPANKLKLLDQRETELLEENKKIKGLMKSLKEDRGHYRKKCEEKEKEIKDLKIELDSVRQELEDLYAKDKEKTPRKSRVNTIKNTKSAATSPRASRTSSRRPSRSPSVSSEPSNRKGEKEKQRKIETFKENHAAKTIQKKWKVHREEQKYEEAADLIETSMNGHLLRKKQLRKFYNEEDESTRTSTESEAESEKIVRPKSRMTSQKNTPSHTPTSRSRSNSLYKKKAQTLDDSDDEYTPKASRQKSISGKSTPKETFPSSSKINFKTSSSRNSYRSSAINSEDSSDEESSDISIPKTKIKR